MGIFGFGKGFEIGIKTLMDSRRNNMSMTPRKIHTEYRGKIEEKISDISPRLGKVVHKINNATDTIDNALDSLSIKNSLGRLIEPECRNLQLGDHLYVQRLAYTHHGLYVGGDCVIHYLSDRVQMDDLETFADGAKILKKNNEESPITYDRDEVVVRARFRYGESNYNLVFNNCENFVRWCRCGAELYSDINY